MEEQSTRVYYEIIDEVCNKILEEGPLYDIDRATVYSIQTDWIKNLENIQSEPKVSSGMLKQNVRDDLIFSDEEEDSYLPDDEVDAIEENIDNYMMCLFVKVPKSKNKWKCSFKQGFININSVDIPFSNANGELEW